MMYQNASSNVGKAEGSGDTPVLFQTVLLARKKNVRPSALELALRPVCGKLRVVKHLSGAHLLFQSADVTLAVRVYDTEDCRNFSKTAQLPSSDNHGSSSVVVHNNDTAVMQALVDWHQGVGLSGDVDNLLAFRNSFKYSVVLMVLEEREQLHQLSHAESFFHRVQVIMNGVGNQEESDEHNRMARMIVVPNVNSALSVLSSVFEALNPAKRERKAKYFAQRRHKWLLPSCDTVHRGAEQDNDIYAASFAASAFREWAKEKLPEGEDNVLLSLLGTLKAIVATGNQSLEHAPIDDQSRYVIQSFFGSIDESQVPPPLQRSWEVPQAPVLMQQSVVHPALGSQEPQRTPNYSYVGAGAAGPMYANARQALLPHQMEWAQPAQVYPAAYNSIRGFQGW